MFNNPKGLKSKNKNINKFRGILEVQRCSFNMILKLSGALSIFDLGQGQKVFNDHK